jgi:UDP-galactopyranose mutase
MDELSMFHGAPPQLKQFEAELLGAANVVFTGGVSLYEAKKSQHRNIHPVPSSIDVTHFAQAREIHSDPPDQAAIPHPRLGFAGVIDERFDVALVDELARAHDEWHFIMIGPVVKINPESLPKHPNIHYLGMKPYAALPSYFSRWDVAIMPFAMNEATRYISPTKTPEYLAAGKPVVSTPIRDVVRPYGEKGLVYIADSADRFGAAIEGALLRAGHSAASKAWLRDVDELLSEMSWDRTWTNMLNLMESAAKSADPWAGMILTKTSITAKRPEKTENSPLRGEI